MTRRSPDPAPVRQGARSPGVPPVGSSAPASGGRLGTILLAATMGTWITAFSPTPIAIATLPAFVAFLALIERCRKTKHAVGYLVVFGAVAVGFGYRWLGPTVRAFGELDEKLGAFGLPVCQGTSGPTI